MGWKGFFIPIYDFKGKVVPYLVANKRLLWSLEREEQMVQNERPLAKRKV
jgi:hypothetical protein